MIEDAISDPNFAQQPLSSVILPKSRILADENFDSNQQSFREKKQKNSVQVISMICFKKTSIM